MLLPGADDGLEQMGPEEAIEELLARLLEYRRYSAASAALVERFEAERGYLYRSAPLPPQLRRLAIDAARRYMTQSKSDRGARRADHAAAGG